MICTATRRPHRRDWGKCAADRRVPRRGLAPFGSDTIRSRNIASRAEAPGWHSREREPPPPGRPRKARGRRRTRAPSGSRIRRATGMTTSLTAGEGTVHPWQIGGGAGCHGVLIRRAEGRPQTGAGREASPVVSLDGSSCAIIPVAARSSGPLPPPAVLGATADVRLRACSEILETRVISQQPAHYHGWPTLIRRKERGFAPGLLRRPRGQRLPLRPRRADDQP